MAVPSTAKNHWDETLLRHLKECACGTDGYDVGALNPLLVPAATHVFDSLRINAAINSPVPWWGNVWWPIHNEPYSFLRFEDEYRVETARAAYNKKMLERALRSGRMVRGEHHGYSDRFVPIVVDGKVTATLVTGPFATERPNAHDVRARFRKLSRREAHLSDPAFAAYLQLVLSTLVLDGKRLALFEKFLDRLALLLADAQPRDRITHEIYRLGQELESARRVESVWEVVRGMIDERSPHLWLSPNRAYDLERLGLSRVPQHVLACLAVDREARSDPVEDALRRHAFQRSAVELAIEFGDTISGRVGDHGVAFLCVADGSQDRKRQRLLALADRARELGRRRFGLSLHFGVSLGRDATLLARTYQAALRAAESALAQGTRVVSLDPNESPPAHSLRHLREALTATLEQKPAELPARFERYVETVVVHSGYRIEPAQAHLEVGFERITSELVKLGLLEPKSALELQGALDRAAGSARTLSELVTAYRRAIADVAGAIESPVPARRERSLGRALEFIHQHFAEDIGIKQVAKIAGFNSTYFSLLFKQSERVTFANYLHALRLRRAQELLGDTSLSVTRVSALSGYRSLAYFCRAFKREVGKTPLAFRRQLLRTRARTYGARRKVVAPT
jgi:AraC-like DNA-binding protein